MFKKLENKKVSYSLIRTNPKLTGNIQVNIDSNDKIYLSSFENIESLSSPDYKKYVIKNNYDYALSLGEFLKFGKVSQNDLYNVYEKTNNYTTIKKQLDKQYDFFYCYGAEYFNSKLYNEDYNIFAPLWLNKITPNYFIIFKINGPQSISSLTQFNLIKNEKYKLVGSDDFIISIITENGLTILKNNDIFTCVLDNQTFDTISGNGVLVCLNENVNNINNAFNFNDLILKNCEIVKTFDLRNVKPIGKLIDNILNNNNFKTPLEINFNNKLSFYNGISYENGMYISRGENLYNIFTKDYPLINFEEYITNGFYRNKLIIPQLLNLNFLFDDPNSNLFEINRYFGLYVNDLDVLDFHINTQDFNKYSIEDNQTPFFTELDIRQYNNATHKIKNTKGVNIYPDNLSIKGILNDNIKNIPNSEELNKKDKIFYLKDKKNNFYNLDKNYTHDFKKIKIKQKEVELSDFLGSNIIFQEKGSLIEDYGYGCLIFNINKALTPGDLICLETNIKEPVSLIDNKYVLKNNNYYIVRSENDNAYIEYKNQKYYNGDVFKCVDVLLTNDILSDYIFLSIIDVVECLSDGFYVIDNKFVPSNNTTEQAKLIVSSLNNINDRFFNAKNIDNNIIITSVSKGFDSIKWKCVFKLNDDSVLSYKNNKFIGQTKYLNNRIKINSTNINKINETHYIKSSIGVSKINNIVPYIEGSNEDFYKYSVLSINDNVSIETSNENDVVVYELFKIKLGMFSMFPIKDMDFDFYNIDYSKNLDIEKYRYFDIKENQVLEESPISILNYELTGKEGDSIEISYYKNNTKNIITIDSSLKVEFKMDSNGYYKILKGSPKVVKKIFNLDEDIKSFKNFSNLKLKDLTNAFNEYDVLGENECVLFSTKSRVTPFINKWIYKGGSDVRDNPYRLNSSISFGENNFTPNVNILEQNTNHFTHEWFYLSHYPINYPTGETKNTFSYFDFNNTDVSNDEYYSTVFKNNIEYYLMNSQIDYFEKIFNVNYNDSIHNQERFSEINFNKKENRYETLFKGVKIIFKEKNISVSNEVIYVENNKRFENYKFSIVLDVISPMDEGAKDDKLMGCNTPLTIQFIENKNFKFIVMLITLSINDFKSVLQSDYNNFYKPVVGECLPDYLLLETSINEKTPKKYDFMSFENMFKILLEKQNCGNF